MNAFKFVTAVGVLAATAACTQTGYDNSYAYNGSGYNNGYNQNSGGYAPAAAGAGSRHPTAAAGADAMQHAHRHGRKVGKGERGVGGGLEPAALKIVAADNEFAARGQSLQQSFVGGFGLHTEPVG